MIRGLLEIAALSWCSARYAPIAIKVYFLAQLFAAVAVEGTLLLTGSENSRLYVAVFLLSEIVSVLAMLLVALESVLLHPRKLSALVLGLTVAASVALIACRHHHLGLYNCIAIADGSLCVMAGVVAGMGAPYLGASEFWIALAFMAYWMVMGGFELGYSLHLWEPQWLELGEWFPAAVTVVGCCTISRLTNDLHQARNGAAR